jgi:hypothetical protein
MDECVGSGSLGRGGRLARAFHVNLVEVAAEHADQVDDRVRTLHGEFDA